MVSLGSFSQREARYALANPNILQIYDTGDKKKTFVSVEATTVGMGAGADGVTAGLAAWHSRFWLGAY
jgi:hypothetical protein